MSCRQTPASLLEWSSQFHIIKEEEEHFVYGVSVIMLFNDVDRQIVEESFKVKNTQRNLEWTIPKNYIKRNNDNTLRLEMMILSSSQEDLLGDLIIEWRSLFGKMTEERITPEIMGLPNLQEIDWQSFDWSEHQRFIGMQYFYWQEYNIGLLVIPNSH